MLEEWREVEGWPYAVSSLGKVRGPSGRILRSRPTGSGYLGITICRRDERRDALVHRLVCAAFHGPPEAGKQCDHVNGDPLDNRAKNLRWLTPAENIANRRPRCGEDNPSAKLTPEDVRWIRAAPGRVTNADLGRALGVCPETVSLARSGRTWGVSFDNGGTSLMIRRK